MFNTSQTNSNYKYRINRHIPHIYYKKNKYREISPFLIANFNNKNNKNYYFEYPSYTPECDMAKTLPNFYNEYDIYKSKANVDNDSSIKDNIFMQNFKEEEKKLKILNQNYCENYKDVMQKNIQTYPYGINLNISNIETQEAIDIKYFKDVLQNIKQNIRNRRKRFKISKSFTKYIPKNIKQVDKEKTRYFITPQKYEEEISNISLDSNIINNHHNHQFYEYSKTCSNFGGENSIKKNSYNRKLKSFIDKLEEFFIQTIHGFFAFFIHRMKIYIKIKNIRNFKNPPLLSKKFVKTNCDAYNDSFNKKVNNTEKKDIVPINQEKHTKISKELYNTYSKKFCTPVNLKLKVNTKKHVHFNKDCYNNKINKSFNKTNVSFDIKYTSNQNSNMNLSTTFKSNGLKSTNSKSNFEISKNISNISLTPYKKNIEIFNSEEENSYINKLSRNRDYSYDEMRETSNYKSSHIIYSTNNTLIYAKPKIYNPKKIKMDRKNKTLAFINKNDSAIKSLIIKKKTIKPIRKLCEPKINSKPENKLSEIMIKDIQSSDKRINIFIKYIISEIAVKQFTKEKIRRKILSLNNYKNIFMNNDIDVLQPINTDSFDFSPVITILKTDIKYNNNDINNNIHINAKKIEKLINMFNIINNLYQKYIRYFSEFFFCELYNMDINNISILSNANIAIKDDELNKINISCITNNMNDNNENEIIVEENYSLNNDIENNLLNNNENIQTANYLNEFDFIDKMISSDYSRKVNSNQRRNTSPNFIYNNINENEIDAVKNKLEKWNYGTVDEKKLLRTKISKFKVFKSILKNIRLKCGNNNENKERNDKLKKIIDLLKIKSDCDYNYFERLKHCFEIWRRATFINQKQNKIIGENIIINLDKNKYPIIFKNRPELAKINELNSNNMNIHDSYSIKKFDTIEFEELLKYFRIYLICYFALRLKNISSSDD